MIELESIADLELLRESVDIECKRAGGQDGKGALPHDFWETYSAMANTDGGIILLGVQEKRGRFSELCHEHASDVSKALRDLVKEGFLTISGGGRGAVYRFEGTPVVHPDDVFGGVNLADNSPNLNGDSPNLNGDSPNLGGNSPNLGGDSPNLRSGRDSEGRLLSPHHHLAFVDDLAALAPAFVADLEVKAAEPRAKGKIPGEAMKEVIKELCRGHYMTLRCLAVLVARKPETLRGQYLSSMWRNRELKLAFPNSPNEPRQAYTSSL